MFHVPDRVERTRVTTGVLASRPGALYGSFIIESPEPGWLLAILADDGTDTSVPESIGWEHVSVHARRQGTHKRGKVRTPSWSEMAYVKSLFWGDDVVVVEYHPSKDDYVNRHPHVLHLWRQRGWVLPMPPSNLV